MSMRCFVSPHSLLHTGRYRIYACNSNAVSSVSNLNRISRLNTILVIGHPSRHSSTKASLKSNSTSSTDFYSYTSGRFVYNEQARLKERYVEFDVDELYAAAHRAIGQQHGSVKQMIKLAEGGFNRVFLLQMEDGFEIVAKIPYHIAAPAFYTTASEAATLTYLKSKGIPVPEVYAYCAQKDNPVRSEYILLEKASGVSAITRWAEMTVLEIKRLGHTIVELEKKLFELPFAAFGSLYFKHDVPRAQQAPLYADDESSDGDMQRFCIGPIADYMFWQGRKASLELDRGPWRSPVEYLEAIARNEILCTQKYGKPMEPAFPHNALELGVQHPSDYTRCLEDYISLAPHLLPQSPTHPFNQPTHRHPDLTPSNIFIDPATGRTTCLIDWQHSIIQPQILAAGYPPAFENPDEAIPSDLDEPKLPEELSTLSEHEQSEAKALHRQRSLFHSYRVFTGGLNKPHHAALRDRMRRLLHLLVDLAGREWDGNNVTLRGAIMRTVQHWHLLPDTEGKICPVHFDEAEVERFNTVEERWAMMNAVLEEYRRRICGMNEDGWERNEDFGPAKTELKNLEEEILAMCDGDVDDERAFRTGLPFRDRDGGE
jgi:hypothetical protein